MEGATGDASKVSAKGPGVERIGVVQSKRTHFEVYTQGRPAYVHFIWCMICACFSK